MRTTIFYSLVVIGITITLVFAGYIGTKANTAVAASKLSAVAVVHEPMQPVVQIVQGAEEKIPTTTSTVAVTPATPVSLSIPSINLNAPIVQVGLTANGEMDVPSGSTNNIGWYKDGTIPGNDGSAVLDAHVFAALKNLRYAKVGDSIYVKDAAGVTRHFVIRSSMVYEVASVPAELLFNRTGGKYLNIITCAGTFVPSINTYDHRLIVYAELVND